MFIRSRFFVFLVTISCLFSGSVVAQNTDECEKVLAVLFDKEYCARDYDFGAMQEFVLAEQAVLKGMDPEEAVKIAPYQLLYQNIWSDGISHAFPNYNLSATRTEIDLFVTSYRSVHNAEIDGVKMRLAAIEELLRNRKFDPAKRSFLRADRDKTRERLKVLMMTNNKTEENEDIKNQRDYQIKSTGQSIIEKWKENNVLYKEYGGKSILIDKNIEPLEAMLKQFDYIEEQGHLEINDAKHKEFYESKKRQVLQALETRTIVDNEEEIKQFYQVPYWISDAVDAKKPYIEAIVKLYEDVGYTGHVPETVKNIMLENQNHE